MTATRRPRWGWIVLAAVLALIVVVTGWRIICPPVTSEKPLTIVVSGDTAGWIMPCGCSANQSGGLLRRATYLNQLSNDKDVLYVDAGGAASGTSAYYRVKFEAILRGELAMSVAAHNIGASEA